MKSLVLLALLLVVMVMAALVFFGPQKTVMFSLRSRYIADQAWHRYAVVLDPSRSHQAVVRVYMDGDKQWESW